MTDRVPPLTSDSAAYVTGPSLALTTVPAISRHVRLHVGVLTSGTNTDVLDSGVKPFTCQKCGESFRRRDVLRRHETRYCPEGSHASQRTRTRRACDGCRERKLKCNGARPCRKCASQSRDCTYRSQNSITTASGLTGTGQTPFGIELDSPQVQTTYDDPNFLQFQTPAVVVQNASSADVGTSDFAALELASAEPLLDWTNDPLQWDIFNDVGIRTASGLSPD